MSKKIMVSCFVLLTAFLCFLSSSRSSFAEEREICGDVVRTPELNYVRCGDRKDCKCIGDGKWCFEESKITVRTSNGWHFIGRPRVNCARDNQGSCGWNDLGKSDRFFIKDRSPDEIRAIVLTSSRAIHVNLCGMASDR